MKKIIGLVGASLMMFTTVAQNNEIDYSDLTGGLNTITTAVPFLMISPDSKAGAMGDVGAATTPDANAMHWNPAKLAFIEDDMGLTISYVPWLRALVPDINLSYLSFYSRLNEEEAFGVELRYFSLGNITFTDLYGETIKDYKPNEFALGTAYSRKLSDRFSLAIAGRYIYSNLTGGQSSNGIDTKPGQSIAADIAGYYEKEIRLGKKDFDFAAGANISNIGQKISYTETSIRDFIPINLRLGTSLSTDIDDYNKISFAFDINKLLVPTPPVTDNGEIKLGKSSEVSVVSGIFQSFSDAPGGFDEEMREINYALGSEYWYDDQFALRAGYFFEHATKGGRQYFTFGSGVKYNVFTLDFSYLINSRAINGNNPLANTMRFTLVFNLGEVAEAN